MIKLRSRAPGSFLGDLIARKKTEVMEMNSRTRQSDLEQRLYPTDRMLDTALRSGGARNASPITSAWRQKNMPAPIGTENHLCASHAIESAASMPSK